MTRVEELEKAIAKHFEEYPEFSIEACEKLFVLTQEWGMLSDAEKVRDQCV